MHADSHATFLEMLLQALGPEAFPGSLMGREHLRFQARFLPHSFGRLALAPCIVAAHRYAQHAAHRRHGIVLSHLFNHAVLHRDSFAKYVANFFRRSRSIFTSASSRLSCASSASTSVSGFWCRPTSFSLPAFAARTQFANVLIGSTTGGKLPIPQHLQSSPA